MKWSLKMSKPSSNANRTLGVIPARLGSTRLPRKVLREIAGKPMLAWVYEAARACPQLDDVIIATDSEEVAALCRSHNWPVMLTSTKLISGSDRVHAVAEVHEANIYVNIQGDEPMLLPEHITALLRPLAHPQVDVSTLKILCTAADLHNTSAVKVVTAMDGRALYFSRSLIPFDRDSLGTPVWKHIGLYAYRAEALNRFHSLTPSPLELTEKLEQLRFLENGMTLYVESTEHDTIGVDMEEDLARVEAALAHRSAQPASFRLSPAPPA